VGPAARHLLAGRLQGEPGRIRAWAVEEMKLTARAARAMGCQVVTGFMGSSI
jgi:sugar phosphate isomerase/epimerase